METLAAKPRVGIDVSKRHWDVAVEGQSRGRRFAADATGLAQLLAWFEEINPALVCLEATGGYERLLVEGLHRSALRVSVVNPRHIRSFAGALGHLEKTDRIDAAVIARFAASIDPDPSEPPSENQQRLRALRARRQQVVQSITQEKNRLGTAWDAATRQSIQQAIEFYQEQLKELDQQLAELTASDPQFRGRLELLITVPGVGAVTAAGLLADLPELGSLNRGEAAKLVGLAPLNRDSGSLRGKRLIGGGRAHVRRTLYMATLVATQHNPLIRSYYQQLIQRGKAKMTALIACMRKLLLILNAMIKTNSPWNHTQFA
ncbi:MAG: IS110 family transposase [Pirellulales bacterium]|nr:IS110 family transposase [Pirellulales bacterium]